MLPIRGLDSMPLRSVLVGALLGSVVFGAVPAQAETSIKISLKDRYLTLLDDGKMIGKYPVAIGALNRPLRLAPMRSPKWIPSRFITKRGR